MNLKVLLVGLILVIVLPYTSPFLGKVRRLFSRLRFRSHDVNADTYGEVDPELQYLKETIAALRRDITQLKAERRSFKQSHAEHVPDMKSTYRNEMKLSIKQKKKELEALNALKEKIEDKRRQYNWFTRNLKRLKRAYSKFKPRKILKKLRPKKCVV